MARTNCRSEATVKGSLRVLARMVGSAAGMFAGGVSLGLPAVRLVPDDPDIWMIVCFCLVCLASAVGAIIGAAAGAAVVQKMLRRRSLFWRALLGAMAGMVIGIVPGALCLWDFFSRDTGWLLVHVGVAAMSAMTIGGAVIGSGWRSEPVSPP